MPDLRLPRHHRYVCVQSEPPGNRTVARYHDAVSSRAKEPDLEIVYPSGETRRSGQHVQQLREVRGTMVT